MKRECTQTWSGLQEVEIYRIKLSTFSKQDSTDEMFKDDDDNKNDDENEDDDDNNN